MSVYCSMDELLTAAPFMEPSILMCHVIPQLDEASLLSLHHTSSLMLLLGEQQHVFQEHLMTRSLLFIERLDVEGCVDRRSLYKLGQEYRRSDVMAYAKEKGYPC